ncbi:MAG TPA: GNAT family N-acetyltransferase [Flavobacteriaceae bacterium]|nr:GNAT family N-acetyltransferase [Flavobacteriaceae bacterium]
MKYTLRKALKSDMSQVLNLIRELATFEKEPRAVVIDVNDLEKDGYGKNPLFKCMVAEANKKIIGIALMYYRYSTWKGKVLHLEDLIVNHKYRGNGIGAALLNEVVKFGKNEGVKRITWEVLDWNTPAIEFYKNRGATIMDEWKVVHLTEQGIDNYLAKIDENI